MEISSNNLIEKAFKLIIEFEKAHDLYLIEKSILESIVSDPRILESNFQAEIQELQELHQNLGQLFETQQLNFLDTTLTGEQHKKQFEDIFWKIRHQRVDYRRKLVEFTRKLNSQEETEE